MRVSYTAAQVRQLLLDQAVAAGNQSALARTIGVSRQLLSGVMRGEKAPSGRILAHLKLQRLVVYITGDL
jgi:transcriptional regulator with XRE-family HTH domain